MSLIFDERYFKNAAEDLLQNPPSEQDENLIRRFQQTGDPSLSSLIFYRNALFVRKFVEDNYRWYDGSHEELMQEAFYGVLVAAHTFNTNLHRKFLTYAAWRIRSAIRDYIRTGKKGKDRWCAYDFPLSPEDLIEITEQKYRVEKISKIAKKILTSAQYKVYKGIVKDLNYAEIGSCLGISRSSIQQTAERAKKRIKEHPEMKRLWKEIN